MYFDDLQISTEKKMNRGSDKYITFYLTTSKTTNLLLNNAFMRNLTKDHIVLGYSKKNNAIVLFFVDEKEHPTSFKVTKRNNTKSVNISVQSFLNEFDIDKNKITGRYIPEPYIIDGKEAFVIYLNNSKTKPMNLVVSSNS